MEGTHILVSELDICWIKDWIIWFQERQLKKLFYKILQKWEQEGEENNRPILGGWGYGLELKIKFVLEDCYQWIGEEIYEARRKRPRQAVKSGGVRTVDLFSVESEVQMPTWRRKAEIVPTSWCWKLDKVGKPRAVVLKLELVSESPGNVGKAQDGWAPSPEILISTSWVGSKSLHL